MNNEQREQQIKEAARQRANQYDHPSKWSDTYYGFIDGAKWADSHPAWIPVEERLPEVDQVVWIFTADGKAGIARYDKHGFNVSALLLQVNVTHWMEIVPPPRKEVKNEQG